jgi:F0F1-type ATP synthase delta subunit
MTLTPKDYARALYLALRDTDATETKVGMRRFVAALKARGMHRLLPRILAVLPEVAEEADAARRVTIESARPLTKPTIAAILKAIGADKKSEVVTRDAPDLIGGVRVRTKDGIIDASVSGTLAKVNETLRHAG